MLKNNLLLAFLVTFILTVSSVPAWGDSTNDNNAQTNSSGSNTQITGGYTSTTTNNNDGQTNTTTSTTTNNSTTNGSDVPVNSANAPSFSAMSQDVCSTGISGSVSTLGLGISAGKHVRDLNCERIKLSKVLAKHKRIHIWIRWNCTKISCMLLGDYAYCRNKIPCDDQSYSI